MSVFINLSNHPSAAWSADQRAAAERYGEIIDIPFPEITPYEGSCEVLDDVRNCINKILNIIRDRKECAYLMCQGESTFMVLMAMEVKKRFRQEITLVFACSQRDVQEIVQNRETIRRSVFRFVQFREF